MILKLTSDLFKEHIYMFSDLKKTLGPMATKVGDTVGGEESVALPPTFETVCSAPLQVRDPAAAVRLSCKNIIKGVEKSV